MIGSDNIAHVEINKRVFNSRRILILFVLLFFCYLFYASGQAAAETSYYYLDISLYSEGYAEFEITVNDYGDFGGTLMELPTLNCENNKTNFSIIHNNVRVSEIPDIQTLIGKIDLEKSCMGVGILKPHNTSKDFSTSFVYKNSQWELHPEKYPSDFYKMPILISFPQIQSNDSILVSTRIELPPNTEVKNIYAYRLWEHPAKTQSNFTPIDYTIEKRGNHQIIILESHSYLTKNNPPQAIYIPLEFKRIEIFPKFFEIIRLLLSIILILFTIVVLKKENVDFGILTIVILLFSYYQFLITDKPAGTTTKLDEWFFYFTIWSLLIFIIHIFNKLRGNNSPSRS